MVGRYRWPRLSSHCANKTVRDLAIQVTDCLKWSGRQDLNLRPPLPSCPGGRAFAIFKEFATYSVAGFVAGDRSTGRGSPYP